MNGNFLFKYRGQIPILLFLIVIPFIYNTDYNDFSKTLIKQNTIISIVISLIGFMIRIYTVGTTPAGTSGRNRDKQIAEKLNKTGVYSIIRHPLYLGNLLIWLGVAFFTINTIFLGLIIIFFGFYYNEIMKTEENFLVKKFQNEFLLWKNITPMFIPTFKSFKKSNYNFSLKTVLKREYSTFLAIVISFLYVQAVINISLNEEIIMSNTMWKIFTAAILITLILRSLKKYTSILNQSGRT